MNREVEERIVAMYFDNKDFEKNAKTTIDTLGQLKEGLNIEESATKGFQVFEKIGKTLNFDKANQSLQTMRNRLGSMGGMLGKVFKIGGEPLREAEGLVNSIRGYIGKVAGVDFASTIVNGFKNAFRNLTIAPISAGWNQYETTMDSIKTIMSSTGESLETVEAHLSSMTDYANKTIYSLTDMTSNLGKFTNNGIALERATIAMEGIANATADAGQGAQQASMAMYNISQAMGVGKMTTIDWKSLENANIATQKLKNTFLEMAAASGKLKKKMKKDANGNDVASYFLETDENGKKLKQRIELTAANFREYLSKGWLDKETMLRTFQIYSGAAIAENTWKSWNITDPEQIRNLMKIGQEALEAATQVRTFTKMMDALKESVQSGWSETFKYIFGDMEQGTQLWTDLNKELDGILSASTERRNKMLKGWSEMTEGGAYWKLDENGNTVRTGVKGGREILMDSFFELIDVAKEVGKALSDAFSKVFGKLDAKKLFDITLAFRDLVARVKEWLGDANKTDSRLGKIRKGLQGVFTIIKIGINAIKAIANLVKRILSPVLDVVINAFGEFGKFFDGLSDMSPALAFKRVARQIVEIWDKVKSVFTVKEGEKDSPFSKWIKNTWNTLKTTIKDWMTDLGLESVWETISGWWDSIKSAFMSGWEAVSQWWKTSGIGKFFEDAWNTIVGWFTAKDEDGDGVIDNAPIVQFFVDLGAKIEQAYNDFKKWWQGSGIPEFFTGLWKSIVGLFTPKFESVTYDGTGRHEHYTNSPIVQFFIDLGDDIKGAWETLTKLTIWEDIGNFFEGVWNKVVGWFTPKTIEGKQGHTWTENAPIVQFFIDLGDKIKGAWDTLTGLQIWKDIGDFFTKVWQSIVDAFTPKDEDGDGIEENAPIVQFFINLGSKIEEAFNQFKTWWQGSGIPQFFERMWNEIVKFFSPKLDYVTYDGKGRHEHYTDSPIISFFKNTWESIKSVYETIKGWWNSEEVQGIFKAVGDVFKEIWGWINGLFDGEETEGNRSGSMKTLGNRASAGPGAQMQFISDVATQARTMIDDVSQANPGKVEKSVSIIERILNAIGGFFEKLKGIIEKFTGTEDLTKFFDAVGNFLGGIIEVVSKILNSLGNLMKGKEVKDWGTLIVPGLILLITEIVNLIDNAHLAKIGGTQNFAQRFIEIAGGMFLLAAAIGILSTIDKDKLQQASGVMIVMGVIVGAIAYFVTKISSNRLEQAQISSKERILNNLISTIGKLGMLAIAMALLPNIIKTIGEVKNSLPKSKGKGLGEDLLNIFLGLTALISGVSLALAIVEKITGSSGINPVAALKTVLSVVGVMSVVLLAFMGAGGLLSLIDPNTVDKIISGIDSVSKVFSAIGGAIGGFFSSIIHGGSPTQIADNNANAVKTTMGALAEMADTFDMEKISGISRIITMVQQLANGSEMIDSSKLENFAVAMQRIGAGIYEIAKYILEMEGPLSTINDPNSEMTQKLHAFIGFTGDIIDAIAPLNNISVGGLMSKLDELSKDQNLKAFVERLNKIMTGLGDLNQPDSGIQFDGLTIVGKLFDSIQSGLLDPKFGKFDATPIVDAICDALLIGDSTIGQIVHNMVQNGINLNKNPTGGTTGYKMSEDDMDVISGILKGSNGTDITGLTKELHKQLYGEDGQSGLMGEFAGLAESIPSFSSLLQDKGYMNFVDDDGNSIDLVSEIQGQLTELGTTLSTMDPLTVRITPILSWDNLNPEAMQAQLDTRQMPMIINPENGKLMIDFTGLNSELDFSPITTKLESVAETIRVYVGNTTNAVSALSAHMDGIAAEVARLKLVLDTGALVGEITPMIDEELYSNSLVTERTGGVKH